MGNFKVLKFLGFCVYRKMFTRLVCRTLPKRGVTGDITLNRTPGTPNENSAKFCNIQNAIFRFMIFSELYFRRTLKLSERKLELGKKFNFAKSSNSCYYIIYVCAICESLIRFTVWDCERKLLFNCPIVKPSSCSTEEMRWIKMNNAKISSWYDDNDDG